MKSLWITGLAALAVAFSGFAGTAQAESCGAKCSDKAPMSAAAEDAKDIVDTADAAGSFTKLLAAAKAADLVDALKGEGPLTVFAPNDDAFAKLGDDAIADLLKPENKEKLAGILKYHVVSGKVKAADAKELSEAKTLEGSSIKISVDGDKVKINDATVVAADIEAKNGVIHVIDSVILPPAE